MPFSVVANNPNKIEGAGPAAIPSPVKEVLPDAPIAAEQQKNMLMNALGGFGFDVKKTEPKPVTGVIYGPDEATYYPVVEIDKKKKKYNTKGLLGVSQIDKAIFFVTEGGVLHHADILYYFIDQGNNQFLSNRKNYQV